MRKWILSFMSVSFIVLSGYCDTIPGRWSKQKPEFRTDWSEIKPDIVPLIETPGYNQALVTIGFVGVIIIIGGFIYLLTKKKHS